MKLEVSRPLWLPLYPAVVGTTHLTHDGQADEADVSAARRGARVVIGVFIVCKLCVAMTGLGGSIPCPLTGPPPVRPLTTAASAAVITTGTHTACVMLDEVFEEDVKGDK